MAKYRMAAKGYVNNSIVQPGDVVEFEGKPGKNMIAIEKPAIKVPLKTGKPAPQTRDGDDLV